MDFTAPFFRIVFMSNFPKTLLTTTKKKHFKIHVQQKKAFAAWLKKQKAPVKKQVYDEGFVVKSGKILVLRGANGGVSDIIAGLDEKPTLYDGAKICDAIRKHFSKDVLKETSFSLEELEESHAEDMLLGWCLANYSYHPYKPDNMTPATLVPPKSADKKRLQSLSDSITLLRDLVNTPANDMGPDELEATARKIATKNKAAVKVTKGKILEKNFPLIHAVGDASPRRPRLIDMSWGKTTHPRVTLVGKGVCFDTGGLDLKPSQYMRLMKKDMGGAAHVLALAKLIMELKLPVRLRVLIPAVENSVAGSAFRPGDVFTSRSGITVENTNTDAEGRLILADSLTLASEEKTDLIIDFATLTGSARAALGPDIPAMFSNNEKIGRTLQDTSLDIHDPVWQMPLWEEYHKHIESGTAEIHNSAGLPGDLIYSALFLQKFLKGEPNWVHLDCHAWEVSGKAGRPKGGADTGLRAVFAFLESRYAKK